MLRGLIIKHHLVQIRPVAVRARFCVKDNFSAGRARSDIPARTIHHFITGALFRFSLARCLHLILLFSIDSFIDLTGESSEGMEGELDSKDPRSEDNTKRTKNAQS